MAAGNLFRAIGLLVWLQSVLSVAPTPGPTPLTTLIYTGLKQFVHLGKGESQYYKLSTFDSGTQCRGVKDVCAETKLTLKMEACYGSAVIYGKNDLANYTNVSSAVFEKSWPLLNPPPSNPNSYSSESRAVSQYVEQIGPITLEYWYINLLIYGDTNATYELSTRCESVWCPWSQLVTYYQISNSSAITKEGDITKLGFSVRFNRIELNCTDTTVKHQCVQTQQNVTLPNSTNITTATVWNQPTTLPSNVTYQIYTAKALNSSNLQDLFQNHWSVCGVRRNFNLLMNVTRTQAAGSELVFIDAKKAGFVEDESYLIQVLAMAKHPNGTMEEYTYKMLAIQFAPVATDPLADENTKKKMIIMVSVAGALLLPIIVFKIVADRKAKAKIEAIKEKARLQMELQLLGGPRKKKGNKVIHR